MYTNIKETGCCAGVSIFCNSPGVGQIHFNIHNVKLTFYCYPFVIPANIFYQNYFRISELITLAAMKVFAFGGRGKWKDYVGLYFLIKQFFYCSGDFCKSKGSVYRFFQPYFVQ